MDRRIKDLTSKRFGHLVVKGVTSKRLRNNVVWDCVCDCGRQKFVIGAELNKGSVTSCGSCSRKDYAKRLEQDLTGFENQYLRVIKKTNRKTNGEIGYCIWIVKCKNCGNEFGLKTSLIKIYKSCGCLNSSFQEKSPRWQGVGKLSQTLFGHISSTAWRRRKEFSVTKEYLWELLQKQDFKCAYSGEDLCFPTDSLRKNKRKTNLSLDRIDSSKGYVEGNVQWVTKEVNFMKQSLSESDFLKLIKKIYDWRLCGKDD